MEYTARCTECAWNEAWTTERAAQAAAVWHVFNVHTDLWITTIGARPPEDPDPHTLGREYEDWERQST